jgi:hypothetical protein
MLPTANNQIGEANPHDEVMVTSARAPCRDVLAVYAMRTATNPDEWSAFAFLVSRPVFPL